MKSGFKPRWAFLVLILAFALPLAESHASVDHKRIRGSSPTTASGPTGQLEVPVPHTDLNLTSESQAQLSPSPPAWQDPARIELSTSSWVPDSLTMDSQVPNMSAFRGSGIPQFALSVLSAPIMRFRRVSLSLLGGVSFLRLKRAGVFNMPLAASQDVDQLLFVVPFKLGVEGQYELSRTLSAFGAGGLCPTVAVTSRSVFDDGSTVFGIPFEFEAGLASDLRWLSASLKGMELKLGGLATVGNFTATDFSGVGVRAGLSFPM